MTDNDLLFLAKWSEPREVPTKFGPRLLRKAAVTASFSAAWKASKGALKTLGAGFTKDDQTGDWSLVWWQKLTEEEIARRAASVAAGKALSTDIDLPHLAGLDYMPFQKVGNKFALDRKGALIGDEIGLGKTVEAIGIINTDQNIQTAIIVFPKSLMFN